MYNFEWIEKGTVLKVTFEGDMDVTDLRQLNNQLLEYYQSASRPVILVIDATNAGSLPNDLVGIRGATQDVMKHRNSGAVVFVGFGGGGVLKFISGVVANLMRKKFEHIDSLDDLPTVLSKLKA